MASRKTILVTGATGRQGGAVARSLLARGQNVRAMTRTPEKAGELAGAGAEVVRGDLTDRESLVNAVRGCDGAFLMGTPFEEGVKAEVEQGEAAVMACWKAGVPHVVYSSVCCADRGTGIPHFDSKREVEEKLREIGQPCTILRPVFFMENFESPWMLPSLQEGLLATPLRPDRNLQMICVDDIGEFASEAFLRPKEFVGEEIDLAGDEMSMGEAVLHISCAMNHPIRYEHIPDEKAEEAVGRDMALMYRWFNEHGYDADIRDLMDRYGIRLSTFTRYLGKSMLYRKAA